MRRTTIMLASIAAAVCLADGIPSLPFQARLADASGNLVPDGTYSIRFVIYDEPSGGAAVWPGEVHRTSVAGGLVNVVLGTRERFGAGTNFASRLYLEITVDSNGDGLMTSADPPLAPRQAIFVSPYAHAAGTAAAAAEAAHAAEATHADSSTEAAGLNAPAGQPLELKTNDTVRMTVAADGAVGIGKTPEHALDVQGTVRAASFVGDGSLLSGTVPPGTVVPFAGTAVPDGWLLCDGRGLGSDEYPRLYATLGTTWGGGTGGDTDFRLPDLRSRFLLGAGQGSGLTDRSVARQGGEEAHTLTQAEMPAHSHNIAPIWTGGSGDLRTWPKGGSNQELWPTQSTQSSGSGHPHNNMPPFAVLNFIIKY